MSTDALFLPALRFLKIQRVFIDLGGLRSNEDPRIVDPLEARVGVVTRLLDINALPITRPV